MAFIGFGSINRGGHASLPRGFTLIELMTTIFIAAILMAIAVPSFQSYRASQQVKSAAADLLSTFNFARSEATKRDTATTVIPATTWDNGWSVQAGTTVLRNYSAHPGATITASPSVSPVYNSDGRLGTAAQSFTIAPVSVSSIVPRCVKILNSGKPTNRTGSCT